MNHVKQLFPENLHRVTIKKISQWEGFDSEFQMIATYLVEPWMPACCDQGCMVAPKSKCKHGCPSILMAWRQ
jgi:hypothetical protein